MILYFPQAARRSALSLACLAAVTACSSGPSAIPGSAVTQANAALNQQNYSNHIADEYVLRPADVVRIDVFREADISPGEIPISADGNISVPLLGTLQAAGLTPAQLEDQMEIALGTRYLRNPDVTVNIVSYLSHQVTVEGSVREPGIYGFQPGTRLSGAIALASGAERVADLGDVVVFREFPDGMEVAKFDYAAVRSGNMLDPVLLPGDRIVVGSDGLSQFWQDMLKALPLFALFTRI